MRCLPVKPASLRALTVRRTCSMHGLKQHIRVIQSFCVDGEMGDLGFERTHPKSLLGMLDGVPWGWDIKKYYIHQDLGRLGLNGISQLSAVSVTVNPSLQTLRWVRVTTSRRPWRVNSSLCDDERGSRRAGRGTPGFSSPGLVELV